MGHLTPAVSCAAAKGHESGEGGAVGAPGTLGQRRGKSVERLAKYTSDGRGGADTH